MDKELGLELFEILNKVCPFVSHVIIKDLCINERSPEDATEEVGKLKKELEDTGSLNEKQFLFFGLYLPFVEIPLYIGDPNYVLAPIFKFRLEHNV